MDEKKIAAILPATTILVGSATDDRLPSGSVLTYRWSGPVGVIFETPTQLITRATFPAAGTYTLMLTVSDGKLSSTDTMTVTVLPAPITDPCIASPFEITGIRYPTARAGSKYLQWNSGTSRVEHISYSWNAGKPIVIFTRDDGCVTTIRR